MRRIDERKFLLNIRMWCCLLFLPRPQLLWFFFFELAATHSVVYLLPLFPRRQAFCLSTISRSVSLTLRWWQPYMPLWRTDRYLAETTSRVSFVILSLFPFREELPCNIIIYVRDEERGCITHADTSLVHPPPPLCFFLIFSSSKAYLGVDTNRGGSSSPTTFLYFAFSCSAHLV